MPGFRHCYYGCFIRDALVGKRGCRDDLQDGKVWKAAALLLALVVSLGTLGVAQATQTLSPAKDGVYRVGGSTADRMLSKSNNGAVVATWTLVKVSNSNNAWRAYWTVENTSNRPAIAGCAGYQKRQPERSLPAAGAV